MCACRLVYLVYIYVRMCVCVFVWMCVCVYVCVCMRGLPCPRLVALE